MKPPMLHTAHKVIQTRNVYGDYTATGSITLKCHVRIITDIVTTSNNESYQSNAIMWFEPDSGVVKEDIIEFNGQHYRVEQMVEARKLRNPSVQFLKCTMQIYGVIS